MASLSVLLAFVLLAICFDLIVAVANSSKPLQKEGVGKGHGSPYNSGGRGYGYAASPYDGYGQTGGYGGGPAHYDAYNNNVYGNGGGYGNNNNYGGGDYHQSGGGGYGGNQESAYGGNQQYDQSYYTDNGPFYFHNKHHAYDTHYCSVHGSFSLAYSAKSYGKESYDGNDNGHGKNENYGEKPAGNNYGKDGDNGYDNNGGAVYYKPRFYTRQYCRYAAAASERACHFCCRVVARSSNTSPDEIVSAIFAFDPLKPTNNGAGFDDSYGEDGGYGGGDKKYEDKAVTGKNYGGGGGGNGYGGGYGKGSSSIYQCVCCAPKHNNNYNYDNY